MQVHRSLWVITIVHKFWDPFHSPPPWSLAWFCFKCKTQNHSRDKYHSFELDITNTFDTLHSMADDSVFSIPLSPHFDPKSHSSPIHVNTQTNKPPVFSSLSSTRSSGKHSSISGSSRPRTSDSKPLPGKKQNLRTLVINCNGVSNKRAELENVFNYTDPDIVLLTETKIDSTINPSEFLPSGYKGDIRKDRCQGGGRSHDCFQGFYSYATS